MARARVGAHQPPENPQSVSSAERPQCVSSAPSTRPGATDFVCLCAGETCAAEEPRVDLLEQRPPPPQAHLHCTKSATWRNEYFLATDWLCASNDHGVCSRFSYGASRLSLSKIVNVIVKLLEDQSGPVSMQSSTHSRISTWLRKEIPSSNYALARGFHRGRKILLSRVCMCPRTKNLIRPPKPWIVRTAVYNTSDHEPYDEQTMVGKTNRTEKHRRSSG